MNGKKKGFTLIELLVVVLIIGILAAIALPQYQKAVLKSRYTTLMPIAKGIAEGNEAYFMEHGTYAEDPTELPIKGQESYPDGTTLDLQDTDEYTYVLASRADLPGLHHIIYQHHSKNFPSETHCEAAKDNKLANWVCKDAFKGTKLPGSLTTGYNSYLLDGAGHGITATAAAVLAGVACEDGVDEDHCNVTTNADGSKTKKECTNPRNTVTCTWTTFNTDETKSVCNTNKNASYEDGNCTPFGGTGQACGTAGISCTKPYEITTDEDGNILQQKGCFTYTTYNGQSRCKKGTFITYNEDGSVSRRDLNCVGGIITGDTCNSNQGGIEDRTYNSAGQELSRRYCSKSSTLPCTFDVGSDTRRDSQGNRIYSRTCVKGSIPSTGPCTAYRSGYEYTNSYDNNGQLSYIATYCSAYTGTTCTGTNYNTEARVPVYDENGDYIGYNEVHCVGTVTSDGKCMNGLGWEFNGGPGNSHCSNGANASINWATASCN